jgi:hypothetical protein
VVIASPASQKVSAGAPVVAATDSFVVAGCGFAPVVPHPCVTVQWILTDHESQIGGAATLSTDSVGLCQAADGAVQGPVIIQAAPAQVMGR